MNKIIFEGFGITIVENAGRNFITFDDGELVAHMTTVEVSAEEAVQAQQSEQAAYHVLLRCQQRAKGRTPS